LNTSLRLLIDEAIEDDIADEIAAMQAFSTEYVRKIPHLKGRSDKDVMNYARDEDRIVITFDHDYNSSNFPICTHPGIIRISSNCKNQTTVREIMRKFSLCGHRSETKHAIAHLTQDSCNIEGPNEKVVKHRY